MTSNNKQTLSWTKSDLESLAKVLGIIALGQKNYGKQVNVEDLLGFFKFKLEGRFTVEAVIYAIQKYTDQKNDIPTPADIIRILTPPEKPKISQTTYFASYKQWEKEGFPGSTYHAQVVADYRKQEDEEKKQAESISNDIKGILAANPIKKLS